MVWSKPRSAFAAGVALLVVSAVAAGITIVQLQASLKRVEHAHDVEATLADLESTLSTAGRAQTGYLTSNDPRFLEQYETLAAEIPPKLAQIRSLVQDMPDHQSWYAQLVLMADRRLSLMRASVEDREKNKDDAALQLELTKERVGVADDMNTLFQGMETREKQSSNRRLDISNVLFIMILSIFTATFAISVGLLYLNYRFLQSELAERQRAEKLALESQESLRLLSTRLLHIQDEERRKMSREVHDSLGQYLNLVKMSLSTLANRYSAAELSESLEYLDRCIAETRTISYLLHPPLLDEMGFAFAAKWFLDGFAQRSGIQLTSEIPDDLVRLPHSIELALFRVLQECLTNIHRHSGSPRAEIYVEKKPREITLRIRDYGKGISPELLQHFRASGSRVGVGLAGMRERVREQGGRLDIESSAAGTTIAVHMVIDNTTPQARPAVSAPGGVNS
ncbi:MAG TPA: CHASE3 domain-containing protein [Candidatus Acidoferrales bacterium]|jgi:signal transduction histidine kinase|nr:CHASE3 domain-containing protein [Candidatus Acidoferrales bacterium]